MDITREPDQSLGISLDEANRVLQVQPSGIIDAWNTRCEPTFPDDIIRTGDVIWKVNEVKDSAKEMKHELNSAKRLLIMVSRARYMSEATTDETPPSVANGCTVSRPLMSATIVERSSCSFRRMGPEDKEVADPPAEMLEEVGVRFTGWVQKMKETFGFVRPDGLHGHNSFFDPSGEHDLFFHKDAVPFGNWQHMHRGTRVHYWVVPNFRHGSWQFSCEHVYLDNAPASVATGSTISRPLTSATIVRRSSCSFRKMSPEDEEIADPPAEMLEEVGVRFTGWVQKTKETFGFVTPDPVHGHSSFFDPSGEHNLFFHKDVVSFGNWQHMQRDTRVHYWVVPVFRHGSWQFCCEHVCLDNG
jgi:cold shock CspA family protein